MDKQVEKRYRQAFAKCLRKGIKPSEVGDIGEYYVHVYNDVRVDTMYLLWVEAVHDILGTDTAKILEIMDSVDSSLVDCVTADSYVEMTEEVAKRVFDKTGIMMSKYSDAETHLEEVDDYENIEVQTPFS